MCMDVAKEHIYHLSQIYIYFYIFVYRVNAVVICDNQYDEFLVFNGTKNKTHYNILVPGLRGPAGGPCKYEDISGWGLNHGTGRGEMGFWPYCYQGKVT